jgi:dUTP pyrophosphatase
MIPHIKVRGFERVSVFSDALVPEQATSHSAGYDFFSAEDTTVLPFRDCPKPCLVATGIKSYMKKDEVLNLYARSSMAKRGLVLANSVGVIDSDYYNNENNEGHIYFALWNFSDFPVNIRRGEKIGQGVFSKFLTTDAPKVTRKRKGGFGSSDKN